MLCESTLARTARRQHGIVTIADVEAAGGTHKHAAYRIRIGRWQRLRRGVYHLDGHPVTWLTNLLADVLAGPPGAVASHRSAAMVWGLDGARTGRPEISVPRQCRPGSVSGIVHESTDLHLAESAPRQGIPVTGIHRTLLDVSIRVTPRMLDQLVDDAFRRSLVRWPDLYRTLVRHSRQGRDGCGTFRRLLDRRYGNLDIPESVFERYVLELIVDAGVARPVLQHPVAGVGANPIRIDLAWPGPMVGVELQSKRYHLNSESFDQDKDRLNRLRHLGWEMYEYTWRHYSDTPDLIVGQLRDAIARRTVWSSSA